MYKTKICQFPVATKNNATETASKKDNSIFIQHTVVWFQQFLEEIFPFQMGSPVMFSVWAIEAYFMAIFRSKIWKPNQ